MERQLREQLSECVQLLQQRGWAPNHEGNASVRLSAGQFLATPSGISKRLIRAESLLVVDGAGQRLRGKGKVFSEFSLHAAIYQLRPDVNAIVQAHPPAALGFSLARKALGANEIPKMIVSLGHEIPLAAFGFPGSEAAKNAVLAVSASANAFLIAGNGVMTLGPDVEYALLRVELVESCAQARLHAAAAGGVVALSAEERKTLLVAHQKTGLAVPSPGKPAVEKNAPQKKDNDPLKSLIREELAAALRDR